MYLSKCTLNSRHPRTRSEVDHPYELHRTICKAWDDPDAARILFRPDQDKPGVVSVIVQSLTEPDWSRLDAPPEYLRSVEGPKEVRLASLAAGQTLRFRLRCRPSRRIGEPGSSDEGKRKSLKTRDEIFDWLGRKAIENGFEVLDAGFDRVYWHESKGGVHDKPLGGVLFEGTLRVTDAGKLRAAVENGIGPQKSYGFGLLSLAPI